MFFIFAECHNHVEQLIALASKHNVAVVPIGGGTNVTGALSMSSKEQRMIVSLDTTQMVWLKLENQINLLFNFFFKTVILIILSSFMVE